MNKKHLTNLDALIDSLQENLDEQIISRPITLRLPILDVAQIDIIAGMKDVSRNTLLNEIVHTTLTEMLKKLQLKNPSLAATVLKKSQLLAKNMTFEDSPLFKKAKNKK